MARLTDRQKLQRSVELLAGMSHPQVRSALQARGLSSDEHEEGRVVDRKAPPFDVLDRITALVELDVAVSAFVHDAHRP